MQTLITLVSLLAGWATIIWAIKAFNIVTVEKEPEAEDETMLSYSMVDPNKGKRRRQVVHSYVRMI